MGAFLCSRGSSSFSSLIISCLATLLVAGSAHAQLTLNEIYYDHPGSDAGYEFVELFNRGATPVSLVRVALDFHNGTGDEWITLWQGAQGEIPPGGVVLLGGGAVVPSPDVVVSFQLQNGPDALRITVDGVPTDAVGYGGLDDPAWAETRSAPAGTPGESIARYPDGRDTDDNGADFIVMIPTPGRLNQPRQDAALELMPPSMPRAVRPFIGTETIHFAVLNAGSEELASGAMVTVRDSTSSGMTEAGAARVDVSLAPGERWPGQVDIHFNDGYHWLKWRVASGGDERSHNDTLRVVRRVGNPGLLVSEILSDPPGDCPEFVELYNAGSADIDLRGFGIRDRTHAPSIVTVEPMVVRRREFVVLTSDREALARWFPRAGLAAVVTVAGTWPSLNHTGTPVADSVVVLDREGLVISSVGYPALPGGASGRSLERVDLYASAGDPVWLVTDDPEGATPGRGGTRALFSPARAGEMRAGPNPFCPLCGETLQISITPAEGTGRVTASVFDAMGRRVAELGSATVFPAVFVWDGIDRANLSVLPGLFVVACELFDADGRRRDVMKVVVGCVGDKS